MHKLTALAAFGIAFGLCHAADTGSDDILNKLINVPSAQSWTALGLPQAPTVIQDPSVKAGVALRFVVPGKSTNPWDYSANTPITKPVKNGDVLLLAFWARAEVPAEGRDFGILPGIRIQETQPPYTAVAQDSAEVSTKWSLYYASGVAAKDCSPGQLAVAIHLAAAKQTIDFGPVFVIDFGPGYDTSKLPHNTQIAAAAPAPASAPSAVPSLNAAEAQFAGDLAQIRAKLPAAGVLINNPSVSTIGSYGPDQHSEIVPTAGVTGGQALRVHVDQAQPGSYTIGTSMTLAGAIRKGDTVFAAFYVRTGENETQPGLITLAGVQLNQAPWTPAATSTALSPGSKWQLFYISGVSPVDIPAGAGTLTAQIGSRKQVLDFGPAFVLDLGQGINPSTLPTN